MLVRSVADSKHAVHLFVLCKWCKARTEGHQFRGITCSGVLLARIEAGTEVAWTELWNADNRQECGQQAALQLLELGIQQCQWHQLNANVVQVCN